MEICNYLLLCAAILKYVFAHQELLPFKNAQISKFLLVVTVDGSFHLLSEETEDCIWSNDHLLGKPLFNVNSSLKRPNEDQKTNSLDYFQSFKQDEQVLGYSFFFIFEPYQKGTIYTTHGDGNMEKLPFSIAELVHKAPFNIFKNHILFGNKISKYLAIDLITGEPIRWIFPDELTAFMDERIEQAHIWLSVVEYSCVIYYAVKDSIYPVWSVVYIEVGEPIYFQSSTHPFPSSVPAVSFSVIGNLFIQSGQTRMSWKFDSPCAKVFYLQRDSKNVLELSPENVVNAFGEVHLIPSLKFNFIYALPANKYSKAAGMLKMPKIDLYPLLPYGTLPNLPAIPTCQTVKFYQPPSEDDSLNLFDDKETAGSFHLQFANWNFHITKEIVTGFLVLALLFLFMQFKQRKSPGKKKEISNELVVSDEILGYGSNGTIVFKGTFHKQLVAVKRILNEYVEVAEHEVNLLHQTDPHPNVIRYYYMSKRNEFTFIVLEHCLCSFYDLFNDEMEDKYKEIRENLDLNQLATEVVQGMAHLHSLNIVHRDIKPQNILLSSKLKAVISDFGLCKKLSHIHQSFFPTLGKQTLSGTLGWRPPECILSDEVYKNADSLGASPLTGPKMNQAIDVFSTGCVLYYILSQGKHPFGESFERENNIISNTFSLAALDSNPEAQDLIKRMIEKSPNKRPSMSSITNHLLFWNSSKRLQFIQEISDRLEINDWRFVEFERQLEKQFSRVAPTRDWSKYFDKEILDDLFAFRTYSTQHLRNLLRFVRNKKNHFHQMTPKFQAIYGEIPDEFLAFFTSKFPTLLLVLYEVANSNEQLANDSSFKQQYLL